MKPPELVGLNSGLTIEQAEAQFTALQQKLVPLWRSIQTFTPDEQTIVVAPSLSIEMAVTGAEVQAYEERFLFLLLLLTQPRARMIYITSQAIHPSIIEYYLDLLPGIIPSHARRRLHLIAPFDETARPLSAKLLERPRLLEQIRNLIPDKDRAHLVCYNTTYLERNLALRLGIPMYGADPRFLDFGTKTGCRRLFARAGVSHPIGVEDIHSVEQVHSALRELRARRPAMRQAVVKLNEGVSGEGNATVDLTDLPAPGDAREPAALAQRVEAMSFELKSLRPEIYFARLAERGGIVEERVGVGAAEIRSPSVQLRVTPLGKVELLSTHDQMLGGPSGQSYLGCRFPADPAYAAAITREAAKVGELLKDAGVLGRFALDFVVVRAEGSSSWEPYAIEVNLRKGGTTHPFLTLQFLAGGGYDPETATYTASNGREKFLVATDHLESPAYRSFSPDDLFDVVVRHGLHFGQVNQTGVVFHMLSALGSVGRLGMTAVGNSPEEAESVYQRAVAVLNEEASLEAL
jgi:hypothetical protein